MQQGLENAIFKGEETMTERAARKELMRRSTEISPTVHIGKEGLTESVLNEIVEQLKRARLIKVKVLSNSDEEIDGLSTQLTERSNKIVVVDVRGSVMVLTDNRTWKSLCDKKTASDRA